MLATLTAANANDVTVQNADGSVNNKYDIEQIQKIDITTPGKVIIFTKNGESVEFDSNNVPKLNFTKDVPTSITAPETAVKAGVLRAWADGETVYVSGVEAGTPIAVFSLNGVRIAVDKAGNGTTAVNAGSLPKGVYVIKAGKEAVKILVK